MARRHMATTAPHAPAAATPQATATTYVGVMSPSAADAAARKGDGRDVIGWKLDRVQRGELLGRFPAVHANAVADHVTLAVRAASDAALPDETAGEIVGRADDGEEVEAMVVAISGTTDRPGGGTYHITWSLAQGRAARESNDVIARLGWERFDRPIAVTLVPARFH